MCSLYVWGTEGLPPQSTCYSGIWECALAHTDSLWIKFLILLLAEYEILDTSHPWACVGTKTSFTCLNPLSGVPLTQLYAFNLGIYPQLAHEGLSGGKERHSHLWRDLKDEYTVSCFLGISIFSLAVDKADVSNLDSILQT